MTNSDTSTNNVDTGIATDQTVSEQDQQVFELLAQAGSLYEDTLNLVAGIEKAEESRLVAPTQNSTRALPLRIKDAHLE